MKPLCSAPVYSRPPDIEVLHGDMDTATSSEKFSIACNLRRALRVSEVRGGESEVAEGFRLLRPTRPRS